MARRGVGKERSSKKVCKDKGIETVASFLEARRRERAARKDAEAALQNFSAWLDEAGVDC